MSFSRKKIAKRPHLQINLQDSAQSVPIYMSVLELSGHNIDWTMQRSWTKRGKNQKTCQGGHMHQGNEKQPEQEKTES